MEGKQQRSLLRRLRIGPRLSLAIAVPSIALLCLLLLLTSSDLTLLRDLRDYHDQTNLITAQIEVRSALQIERYEMAISNEAQLGRASHTTIDDALTELGFVGGSDFLEDLEVARQFATNNRKTEATLIYGELIQALTNTVANNLDQAPLGIADQRSRALSALLSAEELLLLEDLEVLNEEFDATRLIELHTQAQSELGRFGDEGSAAGIARLEDITISASWRSLTLLRLGALSAIPSAGTEEDTFDAQSWQSDALLRSEALAGLVELETATLRSEIDDTISGEYGRLGLLAAATALMLAIVIFIALALRRSIIEPLSNLILSARKIAGGEPAPTSDVSPDEIGEMARAFASVSGTIEHLWSDVDIVADAVAEGNFEQRIDTTDLPGDWLNLAQTVNLTLDTGEEHQTNVLEELSQRDALAQISSAAALTTTGPQLTKAVLRNLPRSLRGSTAHLHLHPSGPPLIDLGVTLEEGISALELPSTTENGEVVNLRNGRGVATMVDFGDGPPAVLVLAFGNHEPTRVEPLISVVETAGQILAQGHRRHVAETQALHDREHDLLTQLPNSEYVRQWFRTEADRSIPWSIVGIQPQRLDMVDGLLGRDSRDDLMKSIAQTLSEVSNEISKSNGFDAVLARITKPDFAVIVPTLHSGLLSEMFARRFSKPIVVNGREIDVSATIAYDEVVSTDQDLTQTISNVTASIAQADGREIEIIPFQEVHRELLRRRASIDEWLSRAIENNELSVHFQPIVHAVSTQIEGYETLVRATMDGIPLSPAEFIPVAEDNGTISAIDEFVLGEALAALPLLRGNNPYVAVNLSPVELLDLDLLDRIENVLISFDTPRDRVVFEVTEGATATPEGIARLWQLRELGVRIAIDDFGSGQSNLSYLNELPAQILKLDRSLVTPITNDDKAAMLLKKTIEMAHALGMTVVGEGVETAEELTALRKIFCDRIQGWHTGRPAPLADFMDFKVDGESKDVTSQEAEVGDDI